ncbi:hypothetical protein [Alteromonas sp. 14N.309.X.WAT.G.H12]|uniref:hypothetical protein n=1 Tax=Alteromonas sp. 14N.309.X.WAT.G.H12 TaxID=3120824 RepID=UPI002FD458C4
MKSLLFIIVVAGAVVYLVARPQIAEHPVSAFFWGDEMAHTAQQVLDEVDAQIAEFTLQHEKAQQASMAKINQRLDRLQNQVDTLLQQQTMGEEKTVSVMSVSPDLSATPPDPHGVNSRVADSTSASAQTHLQAITERMQALSFAHIVEE